MDFPPVPDLEVDGFRLALVDAPYPHQRGGDAYLVGPNGTAVDITWRSGASDRSGSWTPSLFAGGLGVLHVQVGAGVQEGPDLLAVLESAVGAADPIRRRLTD